MSRRRPLLALVLVLAIAAVGACKVGPASSLIDGANVEVVVAGTAAGEPVHIDVDAGGVVKDAVAGPAEPLIVYLTLDSGQHTGTLQIGAAASAVCAALVVDVGDTGAVSVLAFDARQLPRCSAPPDSDAGPGDDAGSDGGGLDDAGLRDAGLPVDAGLPAPDAGVPLDLGAFLSFRETVTDAVCLTPPCTVVTTVNEDASLLVNDHGAVTMGSVDDTDLLALAQQATGGADALFAGTDPTCLVSTGGLVVLHRTVKDGSGSRTDSVDVTTCVTGTAHSLRARLELLRSLLP